MNKQQAKKLKPGDRVMLHIPHSLPRTYWFKALDPNDSTTAILATAPNLKYTIGAAISRIRKAD